MRDYDTMPVLDWKEDNASLKAKAQILNQEPVILQMPDNFDTRFDAEEFGCSLQEDTGILYNCDGGRILQSLAAQNRISALNTVAEACIESSSQVDIDSANRRIVIHD